MNRSQILGLIQHKFGDVRINKAEYSVNCPFCVDRGLSLNTTYKLGINLDKGVYHCFRCGVKGKIVSLIPSLAVVRQNFDLPPSTSSLESLPEGTSLKNLREPWSYHVYGFLNERSFPPCDMENKIYFVDDYQKEGYSFGPRLIFPIYQSDTYRGFQGRTIYKNTNPKYIGATGMDRKTLLYNYDKAFSQDEELIITEGFFDQYNVGDTAVATLGKIIADEQIRLIRLGKFKRVIIFRDKDALKEAKQNADRIKMYFPTYIAHPIGKDPGEMTQQMIKKALHDKERRY